MAVQGQHVASVVPLHEVLVILVWDRGCVLSKLQQVFQPLAVFVQNEEGEVEAAAPVERDWGSGRELSCRLLGEWQTLDRVEQPGKACAGISAELGWWGVVVGCSRSSVQNQEDMERAERGEECLES